MRRILYLFTVFAVLFAAGTAFALQPVVVGLNDDIHFDYEGYKANDFHIEGVVYSSGGVVPVVNHIIIFGDPGTGNWTISNQSLVQVAPDQWKFTLDFVTDGYITFCQWIHFGIEFNVEARNIIADLRGWWTLNGKPVLIGEPAQVPVTGFDITSEDGATRLIISNHTSLPVELSQMQWTISPDVIPLRAMAKENHVNPEDGYLGRPGDQGSDQYQQFEWNQIPGLEQGGVLPPGPDSFFDVFFDFKIPEGHVLLLRGRQVLAGTPLSEDVAPDWGFFWHQHQEPIASGQANPVIVAINDDIHFDYSDLEANDFHVEGVVESTHGIRPEVMEIIIYGDPGTGLWEERGFTLDPIPGTNMWKFTIDFKTDGVIKFCEWIHFGIMFKVMDKNVIAHLKGWWTLDGNPVVPGVTRPAQAAVTGFNIFAEGDGTRLIMTNNTDIPITVSQLQAKVFEEPVDLEEMSKTGLGRPQENSDWTNVLEEFYTERILQPDSFFDVYTDLEIPAGNSIIFRGRQLMVNDDGSVIADGDWGWFWKQHQQPEQSEPPPVLEGIKWRQRPDMKTGVNILSMASYDGENLPTVADDWFCLGGSPVTDLHFWGSYLHWYPGQETPPEDEDTPGVEAFRIRIYSDIPATVAGEFSHPGRLLYETWVKDFSETYEASISLPWGSAQEPAFEHKYRYDLDLPRIFWQKRGKIYWLNIAAFQPDTQFNWGWENSMDRWNDIAVKTDPTSIPWQPLYHPYFPNAWIPLDMSFEMTTCKGPVKWLQLPDMADGRNILSCPESVLVADDFLCTNGRPVTEVHFWGSYLTRDGHHWEEENAIPPAGAVPPKMQQYELRFYQDVPQGLDPDMPWSHPAPRGMVHQVILDPGQVKTTYWDSIPHTRITPQGLEETWWEHKFYHVVDLTRDDLGKPFAQEKDTIYWLSVSAIPDCTGTDPCYYWGWETSMDHWNDAAVKGNSSFWQAFYGNTLIDFEDLISGTSYPVGSTFTSAGVSISVEPFEYSDGTLTSSGAAMVSNAQQAGGAGNEVQPNNVNFRLNLASAMPSMVLLFGEYDGNLNISINGDFRNFLDFVDINNTVIGGVTVKATNGLGTDNGILSLHGIIHDFSIGGQELFIDDIRLGKKDMAFLLMTKDDTDYCRADFDRDGDVDKTDLKTFVQDFGRTDCPASGDCEGDFDYDGDVDGRDLAVIAGEMGREDCACGLTHAGPGPALNSGDGVPDGSGWPTPPSPGPQGK